MAATLEFYEVGDAVPLEHLVGAGCQKYLGLQRPHAVANKMVLDIVGIQADQERHLQLDDDLVKE